MQPHVWNSRQVELVEKLLSDCEASPRHSVESKRFRKRNFDCVDDIDALVQRGLIHQGNNQYTVNVLTLPRIGSALAQKILCDADLLWNFYREEYRRDESDTAMLSTAAEAADLSMDDAQRALHYMLQTGWHGGFTTPADQLYSSVTIGEEVLRHGSFSDYLAHLNRPRSVQSSKADSFDLAKHLKAANARSETTSGAASVDLPSWVAQLSPGVRELLAETAHAKASGWNRLAAMGIRAVFDMFSVDALKGDAGVFKEKLESMLREEHLAPIQRENMEAVIDAGNAAAHRGFNPTSEEVETMWRVLVNVLESFYVLKPKASELKNGIPSKLPKLKAK